MCDPTGGVATALIIASTATAAVGTVYAGVQQSRMNKYNAAIARNNEVYAKREADDALERGRKAEVDHYQALARLRGEQIAGFAAGGIDTSYGSPLDIIGDTAALGNADADTIRMNAAREAQGFDISAQNYRSEAAAQQYASKTALVSAGIGATSTILGGASQLQGAFAKYGKPTWLGGTGKPAAAATVPNWTARA